MTNCRVSPCQGIILANYSSITSTTGRKCRDGTYLYRLAHLNQIKCLSISMVPTSLMSLNLQFVAFTKIHPKNSNLTTTRAWSQSQRESEQPNQHGQTLLISSSFYSSPSSADKTEVRCCQIVIRDREGLIRNKDLAHVLSESDPFICLHLCSLLQYLLYIKPVLSSSFS